MSLLMREDNVGDEQPITDLGESLVGDRLLCACWIEQRKSALSDLQERSYRDE